MNSDRNILDASRKIRDEVRCDLEGRFDVSDNEVLTLIDERIRLKTRQHAMQLSEKLAIRKEVFNSIRRLDVLQELIDDPGITEIMVNGMHSIFIEKDGSLRDTGRAFDSADRLMDIIQQIVAGANRTVNAASPIVDARLDDGSRVNVVLSPVALNGPILTIRRFPKVPMSGKRLVDTGSVSREALEFLEMLVRAKYNILISGGTGAGKTTMLGVLSGAIPANERIITIEDSAELTIQGIDNLVSLEARNANIKGCDPISIRDLIKTALRMRPDRIIVGEVRGAESIDMLQAMNVGQDGSMSTIHANSAKDALSRLETMMLLNTDIPIYALRRQMASGIDFLVHLSRLRDGSRKVIEIREITGCSDNEIHSHNIYRFEETGEVKGKVQGSLVKAGDIENTDKLKRAGIKY
ncbi:MAG: CpaF family protein [Lachnospiraceae bacterium]|nr:CpaF family protein [Lachnospiraceae bacterium]MBR6486633.1 CpaF family protein [Lachnospiraceae bacterium]